MSVHPIRYQDGDQTKPMNCIHQESLFCISCIEAMIKAAEIETEQFIDRKLAQEQAEELHKSALLRIATDPSLSRAQCADLAGKALIQGSNLRLGR